MTNTSNSNGGNTVYFNFGPVDTDLRIRVLGLAVQQTAATGWQDPVGLAESMLAFVEGRSNAPDSDCVADVCKLHDSVDTDEFDEDDYEDWHNRATSMLGKTVRVTLATNEDGTKVISEGVLIGFGEGGDFEILEEDGFVHFCWPMLEIELVEDDDDV